MSAIEFLPGAKPPARPARVASDAECADCGQTPVTHLFGNRMRCAPCTDLTVRAEWASHFAQHQHLAGRGPRGRR